MGIASVALMILCTACLSVLTTRGPGGAVVVPSSGPAVVVASSGPAVVAPSSGPAGDAVAGAAVASGNRHRL